MKKVLFSLFAITLFTLTSCEGMKLTEMGKGLERHIFYNDSVNELQTTIQEVVPISYIKLSDDKKQEPQDAYLARIYLKAYWSYEGGIAVTNISDTLDCYYDKDLNFLRTKDFQQRN